MTWSETCSAALLLAMSALLVVGAAVSLEWQMIHDAPLMMYFAWLINDLNYVLYRDLFEHQPIGAHLVHVAIAKVFGYGDLGFRIFDLLCLTAILATTWAWMRNLGALVGWAGVVFFGLGYLQYGSGVSAQRDYMMILPISVALLINLRFPRLDHRIRAALTGLALGMAMTVKPQTGLFYVAIVGFQWWRLREEALPAKLRARPLIEVLITGALGLLTPLVMAAIYLWHAGTLGAFADIVGGYWPLFARLDGLHRTTSLAGRLDFLISEFPKLGGLGVWLVPAVAGTFVTLRDSKFSRFQKAQVLLLVALCISASLFTAAAGRFWKYHWLIFHYFLVLIASTCFVGAAARDRAVRRWLLLLSVVGAVLVHVRPPPFFFSQLRGEGPPKRLGGRVDEIASYLRSNLREGSTVQPLDWTGGALNAMLETRARLATSYATDFYFYHHVSEEYIQTLRRDFLVEFAQARPAFIIQILTHKPWPSGDDTTQRFDEVEEIIAREYDLDLEGDGYRIFRRSDHVGNAPQEAASAP